MLRLSPDAPCTGLAMPYVCRVDKANIAWQSHIKTHGKRGGGGKRGRGGAAN